MILTTIREGERFAIWKPSGEYDLVDGPCRAYTLFRDVWPLKRFSAQPNEYLVVRYRDGRTEHLPGPVTEFLDPVVHLSIELCEGIELDANEAVIVYSENEGEVARRVVRGPALHMPAANEWLHEFRWHGSTSDGDAHDKRPRALRFNKLRVIPDQMYFNVTEVRTRDEALLTIKIMVFFELADIERMLDQTHDPVADFINALTADVIGFAASADFAEFKNRTSALNELASYPQLVQRAERIGYRINKVVYRGYHASEKLQAMHDDAIETRTRLVLEGETERQAQDLEDLKQAREIEREEKRRVEEAEASAHALKLLRAKHTERLRQLNEKLEADLNRQRELNELTAAHDQRMKEQQLGYFGGLHGFDADLTQILVSENRNPDRLIEFRSDGRQPELHMHEQ